MRGKTWRILNIILGCCLLAVGCFSLYVSLSTQGEKIGSPLSLSKENVLSSPLDELKILQLADMQFYSRIGEITAFRTARKTISKAKPDMLVLTGDNVSMDSKKIHVRQLATFLDTFEIPWALVMGNHDYESCASAQTQSEIYEQAKYSLFKKGTVENSYGNYAYKVQLDGAICYALLFMDSGSTGFEEKHVAWYEETVSALGTDGDGKKLKSGVFFHIPTEETALAYEAYLLDPTLGSGEKNEDFCLQERNVGLFAKAKELGSTNAFIYGHDHINSLVMNYQGIQLCYGLKCGRSSYYQKNLLGGNLYTVKKDGSLTVDRIYV